MFAEAARASGKDPGRQDAAVGVEYGEDFLRVLHRRLDARLVSDHAGTVPFAAISAGVMAATVCRWRRRRARG
jgi:hypothetical protein